MRNRALPSASGLIFLTASAFFVYVLPATAAPVTVDLRMHLTEVCTSTTVFPDCVGVDAYVPFSVTYDPDALAIHDVGFGWQIGVGFIDFASSFVGLPPPWGGPITHGGSGSAFFSNNGPPFVEYQDIDVSAGDGFFAASCADGFDCTWSTGYRLLNSHVGTPPFTSPPTGTDFEALLHRGNIEFFSAAYYYALPVGSGRTYLPGSLLYRGRVPEPGVGLLLVFGVGLLFLRPLTWRDRQHRPRA